MNRPFGVLSTLLLTATLATGQGTDLFEQVKHHQADNAGVSIHYVTHGEGPVVLFVHGFPDFWYSWRHQMAGLGDSYTTVAMDLRGYNRSDKPEGVDSYRMPQLMSDISAVIDDLGVEDVTLVGHDWGGAISWRYASAYPDRVNKLVIANLTHPRGYANVLANATAEQQANTQYARNFASSEPGGNQSATIFTDRLVPEEGPVKERYRAAFERSDYDAMVNYYRAAFGGGDTRLALPMPNMQMPVLQFHGLLDTAVDKDGLKGTWDWIDADYTMVTVPDVGHWVQHDAAEVMTTTMRWGLASRP